MVLIISGFVGIVTGLYIPFVAGIGAYLMTAGILLWFTALFGREKTQWSSTVNYYGEVLVAFGAMATIGSVLNMLLTF